MIIRINRSKVKPKIYNRSGVVVDLRKEKLISKNITARRYIVLKHFEKIHQRTGYIVSEEELLVKFLKDNFKVKPNKIDKWLDDTMIGLGLHAGGMCLSYLKKASRRQLNGLMLVLALDLLQMPDQGWEEEGLEMTQLTRLKLIARIEWPQYTLSEVLGSIHAETVGMITVEQEY